MSRCFRAAAWMIPLLLLSGMLLFFPPAEARTPTVQVEMSERVIKVDASISQSMVASIGGTVRVSNNAFQTATVDLTAVTGDWASAAEISPAQKVITGNESISFNAVVTVASAAAEGTYTVQVVARAESPGSSAAVTQNITAVRLVRNRVGIECDQPFSRAAAGQTVNFALRVYNNGSTKDTISSALGPLRGRLDRFSYILDQDALEIESDGFAYFNVNVTLSPNAPSGTYALTYSAQSSASAGSRAEQVLSVTIPPPPPIKTAPAGPNYLLWIGISLLIVGVSLTVFIGGTEIGLLAFLQFVLVPLFVRIKNDRVLDHFTRGQIYGFIKANPGTHYIAIQEHLELQNGVLAYHLKVLEREDYITSERDSIYKRFYPQHMKIPHKARQLSHLQRDMVEALKTHPGTSQNGLARMLGESKQVVGYHIRILQKAGIVRVERDPQQTRCYLEGAPLEVEPEPAQAAEPEELPEMVRDIHA